MPSIKSLLLMKRVPLNGQMAARIAVVTMRVRRWSIKCKFFDTNIALADGIFMLFRSKGKGKPIVKVEGAPSKL
jgi:hypothetical protein